MDQLPKPTIKGIFVNSHIDMLRASGGEEAVLKLKELVGFPIDYKEDDDVFLGDEEKLIDSLVIMENPNISGDKLHFESGKLHFTNWTKTPWSKQLFSLLPPDFKYMMLHLNVIIIKVFQNFTFESEELGEKKVKVSANNNYYNVQHWVGLFQAWMDMFGLKGVVTGEKTGEHSCTFIFEWE
jgi:uncharacterized protein (TIGR02265 family)